MKKVLLSFFVFLIVGGLMFACGGKHLNEMRAHRIYAKKNFAAQMRIEASMTQISHDGKIDYLNVGNQEIQKLNTKTTAVAGKIRIMNPLKKEYHFYTLKLIVYPEKEEAYVVYEVLYEGSAEDNIFNIERTVSAQPQKVMTRLVVEEGKAPQKGEEKNLPFTDSGVFNVGVKYQIGNF